MRPWIRSLSNILAKRPLRDDFPAKNSTLSSQKTPAGCFSGLKYNFIRPQGRCGTIFCQSQSEIYDIGGKILCKTCFGHNSTQNERKSTMFSGFCTELYVYCESAIKTRFKALFKNRYPWIRGYRFLESLHF